MKVRKGVSMKAGFAGLVGFLIFTYGWRWYYLRPRSDKAVSYNAFRAAFTANPEYWTLALAAALATAGVYMMVRRLM
jgi:hypothetical protein